jgi:hypothetical protein
MAGWLGKQKVPLHSLPAAGRDPAFRILKAGKMG